MGVVSAFAVATVLVAVYLLVAVHGCYMVLRVQNDQELKYLESEHPGRVKPYRHSDGLAYQQLYVIDVRSECWCGLSLLWQCSAVTFCLSFVCAIGGMLLG